MSFAGARYVLFIVVSHGGQLVIQGIVEFRGLDDLLARAGLIGVSKGLWVGKRRKRTESVWMERSWIDTVTLL
jgi:hypothetical protein